MVNTGRTVAVVARELGLQERIRVGIAIQFPWNHKQVQHGRRARSWRRQPEGTATYQKPCRGERTHLRPSHLVAAVLPHRQQIMSQRITFDDYDR